jgi:hypothetical protein
LATLIVAGGALAVHGSPAYVIRLVPGVPVEYVLWRLAVNIWHAGLTITTAEVVIAGATRTHRIHLHRR